MHNDSCTSILLKYSRNLRKRQTTGEMILWKKIRRNQIEGYKFRRQHPILNYIIDFYCVELKLAIEVDGSSHDEIRFDKDEKRDKDLKDQGIEILRFGELEVISNIYEVMESIYQKISELEKTSPCQHC